MERSWGPWGFLLALGWSGLAEPQSPVASSFSPQPRWGDAVPRIQMTLSSSPADCKCSVPAATGLQWAWGRGAVPGVLVAWVGGRGRQPEPLDVVWCLSSFWEASALGRLICESLTTGSGETKEFGF